MIREGEGLGYHELADLLRGQVMGGVLPAGSRLQSQSDLAYTYGCSVTTVQRAIRLLRDEGLLDVRSGYATRVRSRPERNEVQLGRGARVQVHRASQDQLRHYGVPWVVVVEYLGQTSTYGADQVTLVYR